MRKIGIANEMVGRSLVRCRPYRGFGVRGGWGTVRFGTHGSRPGLVILDDKIRNFTEEATIDDIMDQVDELQDESIATKG
jgi:hypothetical protein